MKAEFWIKIEATKTKRGYYGTLWHMGSVKAYIKKPESLSKNELAIRLDIEIPDSFFEKPQIRASLTIPENSALGGEITAEIADNISEQISKQLGVNFHMTVDIPTTEDEENQQ